MMQLGWCKGVKSLVCRRESDVTMDSDATLQKKQQHFVLQNLTIMQYYVVSVISLSHFVCVL